MDSYERKTEVHNILKKKGRIRINEVADQLGVTKVTIRADLDDLEKRGLLVRIHGGAILAENDQLIRQIATTLHEREKEKTIIAKLAVEIIRPNSTILLDSGSTTHTLARQISDMKLTVVTNSTLVLQDLLGSDSIELIVSGGVLRKQSMALIGPVAHGFFSLLTADTLFLGATGYSLEKGVSCSNFIEAETKKRMMGSGAKVCLLVDSSKAGIASLAHVCDWDDIDILITDSITDDDRSELERLGVEVMAKNRGTGVQ
ncbi:MAG: DeoR/GlpR transcriptional regulator [Spirochaetales bacterium]|nr:DeoR/GlpR transcriptional regulator [Spirochaetales bacterium]